MRFSSSLQILISQVLFLFGVFFVPAASADVFNCTHGSGSGSCVLSSSDCSGGDVYGGTECSGNNERTLCCVSGGGGSSCPDTQNHCKANCDAYGGLKPGCDDACPGGSGAYYYCASTASTSGGQCDALNSYCKSNCSNYGGDDESCRGACEGTSATRGLVYCKNRTATSGGGEGGGNGGGGSGGGGSGGGGSGGGGKSDTSGGWASGLSRVKTESGLAQTSIPELVSNLMTWILMLFGFIAIIGFVISGILYLTAAGDTKRIEQAKTAMIWSIVGVIVALMGYVIIQAVDWWLGGEVEF